jgi:hypothetical protein
LAPEATGVKRIQHAGGSVLTGDALADAVLDYARTLGNRHMLDVVDIPVINDHGESGQARMLIGSGIPLVSVTASSASPELVDQDAVNAILRRTADKGVARARPFGCGDAGNVDEFVYAPPAFEL